MPDDITGNRDEDKVVRSVVFLMGGRFNWILAATVQNLKKLGRFLAYRPPIAAPSTV
jgi:hypothetical protein